MEYWNSLGRVVIARETSEGAERMCEYLTYSGVDATVSLDADSSLYVVTVPQEQARDAAILIDRLTLRYVTEDPAARAYKENISSFPAFERSGSRFRYQSRTAFLLFVFSGIAILITLIQSAFFIPGQPTRLSIGAWATLGISLALIFAGYFVLKQAESSRDRLEAENAFTLHVMEWFISTYTPLHIDYTISAANGGQDLKLDELKDRRKDLIRSYVTREFSIEDPDYLNYLIEEIYASVFEKTRTVQKAVSAGRHSRMLSRRKKHDQGDRHQREQSR